MATVDLKLSRFTNRAHRQAERIAPIPRGGSWADLPPSRTVIRGRVREVACSSDRAPPAPPSGILDLSAFSGHLGPSLCPLFPDTCSMECPFFPDTTVRFFRTPCPEFPDGILFS